MRAATVLAYVGEKLRSRLSVAVPQTAFCESRIELERLIGLSGQAVVFIDPALSQSAAWLIPLRQRYGSTSFVIYTAIDPTVFRHVVDLIRSGFSDVVLSGYDDERGRLERLLEDAMVRSKLPAVLEALQAHLIGLPSALCSAVEEMFREPRRYRATQDLACAAQMSTRAVFRHFRAAGFSSPRRLVASARVLRAYQLLSDEGRTVGDVAYRLGYPSADQLSHHFVELVGCTSTDARKRMSAESFANALVASVIRPPVAQLSSVVAVSA